MGSVIVKKAKILAAIGIYYGISVISSFATQIGLTIFTYGMSDQFVAYFNASGSRAPTIVAMILLIIILAISAVVAIFYCLTQWLIDRKLNLA
jgi:predicted PurR-regulated permease PerM